MATKLRRTPTQTSTHAKKSKAKTAAPADGGPPPADGVRRGKRPCVDLAQKLEVVQFYQACTKLDKDSETVRHFKGKIPVCLGQVGRWATQAEKQKWAELSLSCLQGKKEVPNATSSALTICVYIYI